MSKRIIVVDELDTHFKTVNEIRDVETFAFSCSTLAIGAARVLLPDVFIVADREHAVEADRFAGDLRAHAELSDVPVLILTPGCGAGDATDGVAGDPAICRIDPAHLGAHLKRLLGPAYAPKTTDGSATDGRRAERLARQGDSLSRIALMRTVDDDHFIAALLREGSASLRDDVAFSAALVRYDGTEWVVESAFAPADATVSMPEPGARMTVGATADAVLRAGTTMLVRDGRLHDAPWRAVVAAPVPCGATVRILFLAAAREPNEPFDEHDRAYVDTLVSLCAARLRQREQLACLRFYAEHDALTGILNRAAFRARGVAALREAQASGARTAVAVLDLDRFHEVNDALGHHKGDALIVEVAAALAERAGDDVVARLGGDAFAILMHGAGDRAEIEHRVARYAERFDETFGTGDRDGSERVHLSASIGIACAPDDADCLEDLLARADAAMYAAKEAARGRWSFFDPAIEAGFVYAMNLKNELAAALLDEDFVLHFQPEIDLQTGAITGAEALIRWNHPRRGLLLPAEFIPFAEEHGLLRSVGTWVARGAAQAAKRLRALDPSFRIWVNVAATELRSPALIGNLTGSGPVHGSLGVEIRQGAAMLDLRTTRQAFAALKTAGISIALDDFGTGHWPLAELAHLPIDLVKLDRSFTAGSPDDERDREITVAMVELGKRLGFETLAKGIETLQQAHAMREAGCTYGQGFLLGHPMPLDDLAALLSARPEPSARGARSSCAVAV